MAISNFLNTKFSALVELIAQETSVAGRVTGKQYQVDAAGAKAINISRVTAGTIGTYTPGSDITVTALGDERKTINLDQKKYFAFNVDDVDAMQANANFRDAALEQHAQQLALEADKYAFGLVNASTAGTASAALGGLGSLATPISITAANVDTYTYMLKEALDAQNAGPDRWLIVPSWFVTKLNLMGLGVQLADAQKDGIWKEGEVMRFAGFNIVMSNSLTKDGTADGYQILAYTSRALPLVDQVQKVVASPMEKQFGELVKGLYVFGAVASFPKEIAVLSAKAGAEA